MISIREYIHGEDVHDIKPKVIKTKKRSPNRIDPIMEKLTAVWKLHPDWRLCQLLANIAVLAGWKQSDLFHFEDEEVLKELIRLEERTKRHD